MWLPFAFARLCQTVACAFGGDAPKTSEVLRSFLLPELSTAVEKDEQRAEGERMNAAFESLARRFGNGINSGKD